jgi:hypothetical protein
VLRRARLGREAAKASAIEACLKYAIGLDPDLAKLPDVAEAWCQARYAWGFTVFGPGAGP